MQVFPEQAPIVPHPNREIMQDPLKRSRNCVDSSESAVISGVITAVISTVIWAVVSDARRDSVLRPILFLININDIDSVCCGDKTVLYCLLMKTCNTHALALIIIYTSPKLSLNTL
jgi:hypothetical protein